MISCVAAIGYVGSVSGPLVIGGLAGAVGLPAALVVPAALSIVIAPAADALSPRVVDPDGCSLRITMNTVAVASLVALQRAQDLRGQPSAEPRALARRARDREHATDRFDAVGQATQSRAALEIGTADSVVGDRHQ